MKVILVLLAHLFACGSTDLLRGDKGNRSFITRRERISQDWEKYVDEYKNVDVDLSNIQIVASSQLNKGKCPNADDVDEYRASCTFGITETIDRDNFLAAIIFSQDVYGVKIDRTFDVLLPSNALGKGHLPSGAKIYRITNGETLSPQLVTVNFTLFTDLSAPPSYYCRIETCLIIPYSSA